MSSYFDKRKQQKLYRQWVENSGLPPEDVPSDQEPDDGPADTPEESGSLRWPGAATGLTIRLTMRHLLYLILIIIVLLITTATLATVLIMRSC